MPGNSLEEIQGGESNSKFEKVEVVQHDPEIQALDPFDDVDPIEEMARLELEDPGYFNYLLAKGPSEE